MFIDRPAYAEFISTSLYKSAPVQPIVPGGVNALYKVFRSGIRFSPNSISQFFVFSRAFIILTVADKAIIFPEQLQNVDKCFCDSVSVWGGVGKGGRNTNIIPTVIDGAYCFLQSDILCNTMETAVMSISTS